MFEDLKARRVGRSAKESARLFGTIGAAVVIGAIALNGKGCAGEVAPRPAPAPTDTAVETRPINRKPLEHLERSPADPGAFDSGALGHLVSEIGQGGVRRTPDDVLSPEAVGALDPKVAVGRLIETSGTLRSMDVEEFVSAANPNQDSLWGFAVESKAGARVVVVHATSTKSPDGGRPRDALGARLEDGADVKVRGYFLQRRTGSVGGVKGIEQPTAVLVGREYRLTYPLVTSIEAPGEASFATMKDRDLGDTYGLNDRAIFELLSWAGRRGAKALGDDIHSGALPTEFWGTNRFQVWSREMEGDKDHALMPDPRKVTLASRGRVFETSGYLLSQDHEDWDSVPSNPYGVDERWKYWFISDYYGNATFLVDSPFPLTAFPDVRAPRTPNYQHVKLFGVFVKNYTYEPAKAHLRPNSKRELTLPFFVALRLEPANAYVPRPIWQNPFFIVGLSLTVFVGGFLLIMTRIEKRESGVIEAQKKRLRKRVILPGGTRAAGAGAGAGAESAGSARGDLGAPPPPESPAGPSSGPAT